MTRFLLNCLLVVLNVAELSQALAELILLQLNCLMGDLKVKLSCLLSDAYIILEILVNALLGDCSIRVSRLCISVILCSCFLCYNNYCNVILPSCAKGLLKWLVHFHSKF